MPAVSATHRYPGQGCFPFPDNSSHSFQVNLEKGRKYLALLDEARCNDKWNEVPDLARKAGKHVPDRTCLVFTARAEGAQASRNSARPLAGPLPEETINGLRINIEKESSHPEDVYQARACLAQALWDEGKKEEALKALDADLPSPQATSDGEKGKRKMQGWTYIVAVRSAYIKERCLDSPDETGSRHEALFRLIETTPANIQKTDEYCTWLERFLMRMCLKRPKRPLWTGRDDDRTTTERLLAPFRAWMRYWNLAQSRKFKSDLTAADGTRKEVWGAYYHAFSQLLRNGYVYPASSKAILSDTSGGRHGTPRAAQASEIHRIEAIYEDFLLADTSFPDASKFNKEVDEWADQVMENWSIMCGPSWHEADLGPDGREGVSRNVADVLYRAASRTYHSCAILRHLFAVHASLGEFHLASRALDSYLEIVLKGKERAEKSDETEPGLDTDETVIQTIVNGIEMLCNYGKLEQAVRAEQLRQILQEWLARHERKGSRRSGKEGTKTSELPLRPTTVALIHRAVGMSKGNWAKYILDASERTSLQNDAAKHLRKSLVVEGESLEDPRTLYALALILAEMRDAETAIATIKHALSAHSQLESDEYHDMEPGEHHRRTLTKMGVIQCWHLLALLLSARQDYEKAEAACDAALDTFEDDEDMSRETKLKQLSFFEKKQLVEIKLTQASLLEITSHSELAITAGSDSLRLYAYLFSTPAKSDTAKPPLRPTHTLKSVRGSFFNRRKTETPVEQPSTGPSSVYSNRISDDTSRPGTMTTADGSLAPPHAHHLPRSASQKLQKRPSKRSVQKEHPEPTPKIPSAAPQINGVEAAEPGEGKGVGVAVSHDLPAAITSQLDGLVASSLPPITLEDEKYNDYVRPRPLRRSPYAPFPARFSPAVQEQYALGLLNSIWVFISGIYRRAGHFEDSVGAVEEAFKLAERAEASVGTANSSARQFQEPGWGGDRSVDQLWADSHAESAQLHLAQDSRSEAISKFETALAFTPDHPTATVGLSNLLLEIYSRKLPKVSETPGTKDDESDSQTTTDASNPVLSAINALQHGSTHRRVASATEAFPSLSPFDPGIAVASVGDSDSQPMSGSQGKPRDLDRLAARDRAFGLLSSLTKLGTSWDDSEAWFALGRAYEESGQPDKAREVLWWVVELEEKKPVRSWACLGQGYSC